MRRPFFCSLLLILVLAVPVSAQTPPPEETVPPLIIAPKPSAPFSNKPDWLPLSEVLPSASKAPLKPLIKKNAPQPPAPTQPVPQTLKPKRIKKTVEKKSGSVGKTVGWGNNVPPLLAPTSQISMPPPQNFSWDDLFLQRKPVRIIATTPPWLAGICPVAHVVVEPPEENEPPLKIESILTKRLVQQEEKTGKETNTLDMLLSLVDLQKNIKQQMTVTKKKLRSSTSDTEKQGLQEDLTKLDKQFSETGADFERTATGVEPDFFSGKKPAAFSWKNELASLLEPGIQELKQLTARARQKTQLKDAINEYAKQAATAHQAVENLNTLITETKNPKIKMYIGELLPAWQNVEKRIRSKLDLTQMELNKLEDKDVSLYESSSNSIRDFFRTRGLYLLIALFTFIVILLAFKVISRLILYVLPGSKKEQRPFHVRILDIFFQVFSVVSAICGLIFVLYAAEDWFLLSMSIILFLGLVWTVRQALPKMWQQIRLVLNMGSIREGERVIYNGVPWKVDSINLFCKLFNPALGLHIRIPIESMIGLISRPYNMDEPWFPCQKGDWVAIDGKPFAKVTSLSHEQVEVVELGGRRTIYQTATFLGLSPTNLSRNFSIRLAFGLSYNLQADITTLVPETLNEFILKKLEESGYGKDCLNLTVDFLQAGASSLDLIVVADFKGEQAAIYRRLERAFAKWCVECCNANNWEIPFPQMTVHLPGNTKS